VTNNGTEITDIVIDPQVDQVQKVTHPTVNGVRNTVEYGYYPNGNISFMKNSLIGSKLIKFDYDSTGNLTKVTGTNDEWSGYMFDDAGRLKKRYVNDGTRAYNTYYDYNERGLLSRMWQETISGTVLMDDTFIYDENGNKTEIRHKDGSKEMFDYDLSDQLLSEQKFDSAGTITSDISYDYYPSGNRKSRTVGTSKTSYGYDKANQMTSVNSTSLSYDGNGNTLSDGSRTFNWNAENQLTSVVNSSGATIGQYEYNQEGLRTKKIAGGATQIYYYNAGKLAYITDETNKLRYSFTRDPMGLLLTMTDHTGTSPVNYSYVLNQRGDVLGLRDKNGTMVVSYEYEAFGRHLKSEGTITTGDGKLLRSENPFRYASYVYDEETYLYYLEARYYRPLTGRFLTRDPIYHHNLYIYTGNDPLSFVDPSGLKQENQNEGGAGGIIIAGISLAKWIKEKIKEGIKFIKRGSKDKGKVNHFKNGDLFETSITTSKGTKLGALAEVEITGKTLKLKDIAIYAQGSNKANIVGPREIIQWKIR
jgi:RHS repeat-associated protein